MTLIKIAWFYSITCNLVVVCSLYSIAVLPARVYAYPLQDVSLSGTPLYSASSPRCCIWVPEMETCRQQVCDKNTATEPNHNWHDRLLAAGFVE